MELKSLRNATETHHQKVEAELDLLRSSLTLAEYITLLERFYGFHRIWEPQVAALLESHLPDFFASRRKLHHIEADLRHFGCGTEGLLGIASCQRLPPLTSIGAALGSLYVVEGSTLGGRVLARHFGEHLGIGPESGCRYFSGYAERTGHMWRAFGELMASRSPSEDEETLTAAVATFECLREWLGRAHG